MRHFIFLKAEVNWVQSIQKWYGKKQIFSCTENPAYNTSVLATAFFSLIQSLPWTSVLHALEHWSDGFCKGNFPVFSCTWLFSERRWQALDSCLSWVAVSQFVLLWPSVKIAAQVPQPPAVPSAGSSWHYAPQGPVFCSLVPAHVSDRHSASLERGVIYSYLENTCWIHDMVQHEMWFCLQTGLCG